MKVWNLLRIAAALYAAAAVPGAARAQDSAPSGQKLPTPDAFTRDQLHFLEERLKELELKVEKQNTELSGLRGAQLQPNERPAGSEKGAPPPLPSEIAVPGEPFAWGDFTWMNGNSRQVDRLLDSKYFTGQLDVDINYTYSFNHPVDDTVVGSTALARNNEFELSFLGLGGDLHAGHVRGRLMLQFGTRSTVVPRNDLSILRGQFDIATAYRYVSEGYAGYHWNYLHGVNLDVGIFMSYVGLFSYDNFENWAYQPSFTSDNTPWFFNGARLQVFPTDRLKVELWLINGWQTYNKFNNLPGVGYQLKYAPREWLSMVFNGYIGTDTQDHPGRVRVHSDNSVLVRYFNHPGRFFHRAAFSVTADLGFEQGDGVTAFGGNGTEGNCTNATPCTQDFVSAMAYNRFWFKDSHFGWTFGGGFIHNPGRYLVLIPTGVAAATFDSNSGTSFDGWDASTTVDWMPAQYITWRLELVHREVNTPYFAGRGGVTGPDGYKTGGLYNPDGVISSMTPPGWTPDLRKSETRLIAAAILRF